MTVKQVFNTSAELDYPTVLPTLDLDFANSKTLDPRIDFTRASGGSYVGADGLIKYAGVNEARFDHDPTTGESLGLLVEESRTNLFPYSEDFSKSAWEAFGTATKSYNVVNAPDGSLTADSINFPLNTFGGVFDNIAASANTTYTFSSYIKGTPGTKIRILFNFNVSGVTSKIVTVSDVWQRFDVTATSGASDVNVSVQYDSGGLSGGGTFYVWGAQVEQGSFASSYIPTQGSTRTRAADSVEITGKNFSDFFNKNEGTSLITYRPRFDGNYQSPFATFFAFSDNITSDRTMGFAGNTNSTQLYFIGSSASLSTTILPGFTWLSPPTPSSKRTERAVVSYGADYIRMYENSNSFFSTSPTYGRGKIEDIFKTQVNPPSVNYVRFLIGDKNGNSRFNCTIQNFRYYPKDLGPQTLKNISQIYP